MENKNKNEETKMEAAGLGKIRPDWRFKHSSVQAGTRWGFLKGMDACKGKGACLVSGSCLVEGVCIISDACIVSGACIVRV